MELIHTCYRITDIDRSVGFYEALGFEERGRFPIRDEAINVFMGLPGDGNRLELTYNFGVDSFHAAALAAGGSDNGPPGIRPEYHENYYAAFVVDPDGHNIEAVCQQPQ